MLTSARPKLGPKASTGTDPLAPTWQNMRRKAAARCLLLAVRPEGANYLWRKNPPRELSIDLVADERLGRVTGRAEAS
jgi:hypothetical protein